MLSLNSVPRPGLQPPVLNGKMGRSPAVENLPQLLREDGRCQRLLEEFCCRSDNLFGQYGIVRVAGHVKSLDVGMQGGDLFGHLGAGKLGHYDVCRHEMDGPDVGLADGASILRVARSQHLVTR